MSLGQIHLAPTPVPVQQRALDFIPALLQYVSFSNLHVFPSAPLARTPSTTSNPFLIIAGADHVGNRYLSVLIQSRVCFSWIQDVGPGAL